VDRLKEMGEWVSRNAEAIYGTRGGPFLPTERMVSTHKDNKLYLHFLQNPGKKVKLPLDAKIGIKKAYFLMDDTPIALKRTGNNFTLGLPASLPDETATVVVVELDGEAADIEPIKL
jgi:alpha-L-fucosidase